VAIPILLHGIEIGILRKRDKKDWHYARSNFSEKLPVTLFFKQNELRNLE
jgi:hypothetical protein